MIQNILKACGVIVALVGLLWITQKIYWEERDGQYEERPYRTIFSIEKIIENIGPGVFYTVYYRKDEELKRIGLSSFSGADITRSYEVRTIPESNQPSIELYRGWRKSFLWHQDDARQPKHEHTILYLPHARIIEAGNLTYGKGKKGSRRVVYP